MSYTRFLGFFTIILVSFYSQYSFADDTDSGVSGSSFDPSFFASVGLVNWSGFTSDTADAYAARVAAADGVAASSISHDEGSALQLGASVGMRLTENVSMTFRISDLPVVDSTITGGTGELFNATEIDTVLDSTDVDDGVSDLYLNTKLHGWNAQVGVEYSIPLGEGGVKAGVQAGLTQSRLKVREVVRSNFKYDADDPNPFRPKGLQRHEWQTGGFIGIGLSIPISLMDKNTELSFMFTNALGDDDWGASQSLNANLVYNFE